MMQFSMNRVLHDAWKHFRRGWKNYLIVYVGTILLYLTAAAPLYLFWPTYRLDPMSFHRPTDLASFGLLFVSTIIFIFGAMLLQATQWELTRQLFAGQIPDLGSAVQASFKQAKRYFATIALETLGILAGFVLVIIPGVLLMISWILGGYIVMKENLVGTAALKRSFELTRPAYGWVALIVLTLFLLNISARDIRIVHLLVSFVISIFMPSLIGAMYDELVRLEQSQPPAVPHPSQPVKPPELTNAPSQARS